MGLKIWRWILVGLGAVLLWRIGWWLSALFRESTPCRGSIDLTAKNRDFYQLLWGAAKVVAPDRFNTWPLVSGLCREEGRRLEVGAGLRPRLPLEGTKFVDLSEVAVAKLRAAGADAVVGVLPDLPLEGEFDVVAALDVLEHVEDDVAAFAELARVTGMGGVLLLSVPLFQSAWTEFDEFVGHSRRYEVDELVGKTAEAGFEIERSAFYGMAPKSRWLLEIGAKFVRHHPQESVREYARWIGPMGVWFQRPLEFREGLVVTDGVDEVILVCRRTG